MSFGDKLVEKLLFGRSRLNSSALRSFYSKMLYFSKKIDFSRFSIDRICLLTDRNCDNNFWLESAWLNWYSIDARLIETEKFSVSKFFTKVFFFFMHHLCLGFTCIALIFCIRLVGLQPYLSLFSHITCIHFAKLGTQLDLKIDWLIFELCTF